MSNDQQSEKNWKEKLRIPYRMVIRNEETYEEVGAYRLNLLNVYIMISSVFVVLAGLVFILIAFTPLRRYIPGYGDANKQEIIYELTQSVEMLEKELAAQELYTNNFRRILVSDDAEIEALADIPNNESEIADSLVLEVERIKEDEELRREVEMVEIGDIARQARSTNVSPREKSLEQLFFIAPVNGEISAPFMGEKEHMGVDVLAPKNTAIKAAFDGVVFISDWTLETGNVIGIQHANNVITFYKHNSVLLKKAGSFVKAGEAVAIIGNTGTLSDGPHLHFELWHKGQAVDPTDYISF